MPNFNLPSEEETQLVINRKGLEPVKIDLVAIRSIMRECRGQAVAAGREEEYVSILSARLNEEYNLGITTFTQVELLSKAIYEAIEDLEKKSSPSQE